MEHDSSGLTLVSLIRDHFERNHLPYEIIPASVNEKPKAGVRARGGIPGVDPKNDWLGWIYDTEFKTYNWGINYDTDIVKQFSASDPEFFPKLDAWLPECIEMWRRDNK